MNCPICHHDTFVKRTDGDERRRECLRCHHRFTTVEVLKEDHQRQQQAIAEVKAVAEKLDA